MESERGAETTATDLSDDKTQPPVSNGLRYGTLDQLFDTLPQIRVFMNSRPREDETPQQFLASLAESSTPEEALTFTAFAARPKMAVWWGYECLRQRSESLDAEDRKLMEQVAAWTGDPSSENRYRVMKTALFAGARTPAVLLGLAAGWSGGPIAPNDPAPIPIWRAPKAVAKSVLTSLAGVDLDDRARHIEHYVKLAETVFRGF